MPYTITGFESSTKPSLLREIAPGFLKGSLYTTGGGPASAAGPAPSYRLSTRQYLSSHGGKCFFGSCLGVTGCLPGSFGCTVVTRFCRTARRASRHCPAIICKSSQERGDVVVSASATASYSTYVGSFCLFKVTSRHTCAFGMCHKDTTRAMRSGTRGPRHTDFLRSCTTSL